MKVINNEPVEIAPLIDEVLNLTEATALKRKISIKVKPITRAVVIADRLRLKQVLTNLVSNAIKYNKEGGYVSIETLVEKNKLEIGICDNGPGLSEEEQRMVFEPFERLTVQASKEEGAGLGLMITKSLVEKMDGEIGVESIKHKGSCFWIKLAMVEE